MKWQLGAVLLLVACTSPNPNYVGSGSFPDGSVDGAPGGPPLVDGGGGDLAPVCSGDQRQCLATSGSAVCMGGQFGLDRKCPTESTCQGGYCQPPAASATTPAGHACAFTAGPVENACFSMGGATTDLSCQPFVSANKMVSWVCAHPVGTGTPGTACTKGSDCRTGFCGSNGTCFRGCETANDCPSSGGPPLNCDSVTITVEGVQVTVNSCVP
jgi:hypothetical protein